MLASIDELFDFALEETSGIYNDQLWEQRELFRSAYARLATQAPKLTLRVCYASRGDSSEVATNVKSRKVQVEKRLSSFFSEADIRFDLIGAAELVALHRRVKNSNFALRFEESLSRENSSYVFLVVAARVQKIRD